MFDLHLCLRLHISYFIKDLFQGGYYLVLLSINPKREHVRNARRAMVVQVNIFFFNTGINEINENARRWRF
jgi:hypothetical protein